VNLKTLAGVIVAASLFSSAAFGQTLQITGTVSGVTDTQITMKSGTDTWTIKRTATTKVTAGNLTVGSVVTVLCLSMDAHKNEGPSTGQ
jgi:hypothetical protein